MNEINLGDWKDWTASGPHLIRYIKILVISNETSINLPLISITKTYQTYILFTTPIISTRKDLCHHGQRVNNNICSYFFESKKQVVHKLKVTVLKLARKW